MSILNEYLVQAYIADRHREALQQRLPRRHRDTSRQEVQRTKPNLPYGALTYALGRRGPTRQVGGQVTRFRFDRRVRPVAPRAART